METWHKIKNLFENYCKIIECAHGRLIERDLVNSASTIWLILHGNKNKLLSQWSFEDCIRAVVLWRKNWEIRKIKKLGMEKLQNWEMEKLRSKYVFLLPIKQQLTSSLFEKYTTWGIWRVNWIVRVHMCLLGWRKTIFFWIISIF